MKNKKNKERELSEFSITTLEIMGRLILQDNVDDTIIDNLRKLELIYDSLYKKYLIMEERVNIDDKTSLLKYNENFLVNIVKTASRYWQHQQLKSLMDISYLRVDLDDFSLINNRYGHAVGDTVLKAVSHAMKEVSRPTDYLFRFGGEEFDIVLPATPREGAEVYARKLLEAIRDVRICNDEGQCVQVTSSMGLDSFQVDLGDTFVASQSILDYYHDAQKHADYACYDAKLQGKDRYAIYSKSLDYKDIMLQYSHQHKSSTAT